MDPCKDRHICKSDLKDYLRRDDYFFGYTLAEKDLIVHNLNLVTPDTVELTLKDKLLTKLTYLEAILAIKDKTLVPGSIYIITDYQVILKFSNLEIIRSPENEIILLAIDNDKFSKKCYLCIGETLYSAEYDLTEQFIDENDAENRIPLKGKITYLKDNNNNSACYDFKNMVFLRDGKYYHTFSDYDGNDASDTRYHNNEISQSSSNIIFRTRGGFGTGNRIDDGSSNLFLEGIELRDNHLSCCKNITITGLIVSYITGTVSDKSISVNVCPSYTTKQIVKLSIDDYALVYTDKDTLAQQIIKL